MKSYKELFVYQKSVDLAVDAYKITDNFPKHELYGITSQIRRCVISIPSNIAEGQRRGSLNEYIQFLRISFASGAELETQLLIAFRVGYLKEETFNDLMQTLEEIMRMLNKLIAVLLKSKK